MATLESTISLACACVPKWGAKVYQKRLFKVLTWYLQVCWTSRSHFKPPSSSSTCWLFSFPTAANAATAYVSDIDKKKPLVCFYSPKLHVYAWKPVKSGAFQVYFEGRKEQGFHFTYEFHACSWTVKSILLKIEQSQFLLLWRLITFWLGFAILSCLLSFYANVVTCKLPLMFFSCDHHIK